ncbi:MAG: hypothetical protein P4L03_04725 [Terracidiphilus sp.]|nr:hypothetical protein [Terracidiphilus sp.]
MATGKPYEATGVQHNKRSLADGTVTTHDFAVSEARDSSGRVLEVVESDIPATSTHPATHLVVESLFDPAARTLLQWTNRSKIGTLLHLPPVPVVNVERTAPKTDDRSVVLGHRMIHGYLCTGHKTQTVTAAGAVGNAEPITATREWWIADELRIVMLNITDDARNGETTKELTAINPTEPDPARFHLPSGYTIREVKVPGSSTAGALKPVPPLDLANAPALSREDAIAKLTSPTQSERLEGAAVLVKGAQSSPDAAAKRDVAYRIARLGIGLAEAHVLAGEAVKSAESDCASPSAPLARTMDFSHVVVLARYWDTLGYVYYREGDSVTAKSYIESAWKLDPLAYYGSHLSSIYSEAGNNEEAARILKAASQAPGSDELKGDLQERARALGGNAGGGEESTEPGEALANPSQFEGTAVFEETYSAGSKSPTVNFVSGAEGLRALIPALAKEQANSFVLPDNGPERVVRRVQVVCGASSEKGCRVRAYSATQARTLAQMH